VNKCVRHIGRELLLLLLLLPRLQLHNYYVTYSVYVYIGNRHECRALAAAAAAAAAAAVRAASHDIYNIYTVHVHQ
jgi:hypothetical protein